MPPFKVSPEPPCPGLRASTSAARAGTPATRGRVRGDAGTWRVAAACGACAERRAAAGSGLMPADQAVAQVLHSAHGSAFLAAPPLAQWATERGAAQADDFGWARGSAGGSTCSLCRSDKPIPCLGAILGPVRLERSARRALIPCARVSRFADLTRSGDPHSSHDLEPATSSRSYSAPTFLLRSAGSSTWVNSVAPLRSMSRTVMTPLAPSMST